MSILFFVFILSLSIPALYAAAYKRLFTTENQKKNTYLFRLFHLLPFCIFIGFFVSFFTGLITWNIIWELSPDLFIRSLIIFGEDGYWVLGALVNIPIMLILTQLMIIPGKKKQLHSA